MDVDRELKAMLEERIGKTLKGRYTLDALLGVGGMASVYRGRHRNGNKVAVKVLHPDLAELEDIRARFTREGYVANKVDHRGAVTVLDDDVDDEDGSVFLVMELLEGETLEELILRRGGTLPADEILPRMKQLLEVLAAAHDKGIVHRDLKPENVFLEKEGGGLKVLDFGIARLADGTGRTTTHTGQVIGTPAYMAPEQARGETTRVGPATDLWAVGAIMFRALTGRVVYDAKAPAMSVVLAGTKPPPKIADVMPSVDPALAAIIDRTIDPVVEERWSSAAAMLAAIEKLENNGPPTVSKTEAAAPSPSAVTAEIPAVGEDPAHLRTVLAEPAARPLTPSPPLVAEVTATRPRRNTSVVVAIGATLVGAIGVVGVALALRPAKSTDTAPAPSAVETAIASSTPSATASAAPTASTSASATVLASAPTASSKEIRDDMPAPPASKAPKGIGTVSITAVPHAKVLLNGAVLCEQTPCKKPLPAGEYTLRLQGAKSGKNVHVTIRPGETTSKIVAM